MKTATITILFISWLGRATAQQFPWRMVPLHDGLTDKDTGFAARLDFKPTSADGLFHVKATCEAPTLSLEVLYDSGPSPNPGYQLFGLGRSVYARVLIDGELINRFSDALAARV